MSIVMWLNTIIKENILVKEVLRTLEMSLVIAPRANTKYEGTIRNAGDTVSVQIFPAISHTTGTQAWADIPNSPFAVTKEVLTTDTLKQCRVEVTDYEEIVANFDLVQEASKSIRLDMAKIIDSYVAGKAVLGTPAEHVVTATVSKANAYETTEQLAVLLDEANVPDGGRVLFVTPAVASMLRQSPVFDGTAKGLDWRLNGYIGQISGFMVFKTNNLPENVSMLAMDDQSVHLVLHWKGFDVRKAEKGFRESILSEFVLWGTVFSPNAPRLAYVTPNYSPVVPVTWVELDQTGLNLGIWESQTLIATVSPNNATNKNVTWSSSDSEIASVNNGVVQWVAEWTATITVTTVDWGHTDECEVVVSDTPSTPWFTNIGIVEDWSQDSVLTQHTANIYVQTTPAPDQVDDELVVTSSDADLLEIYSVEPYAWEGADFMVRADAKSSTWTATVKIASKNNPNVYVEYEITIEQRVPVSSVWQPTESSVSVYDGMTEHVFAVPYSPSNANYFNSDIAVQTTASEVAYGRVSGNYEDDWQMYAYVNIQGQSAWTCELDIFASLDPEGQHYTVEVSVTERVPVEWIALDTSSSTLAVWATWTIGYTITPVDATIQDVEWYSDDQSVAEVDSSTWVITAIGEWTCTIVVRTLDGNHSDTCALTVTSAPQTNPITSVSNLSANSVSIVAWQQDNSITFDYLPADADDDSTVTFVSTDDTIATADITGGGQGTAQLTIDWLAEWTATISIYVGWVDSGLAIAVTVTAQNP